MMKPLTIFAALMIVGCSSPAGHTGGAVAESDQAIRIAAWNIAHLAGETGRGCVPREDADYRLIANTIEQVDADVWLLQEIENEQALARVFDPDAWTFHVEERQDTGTGPLCRGRDDGVRLRMQRTAIVVRGDLDHARNDDLVSLDVDQRGFLRHGVTISIERATGPLDLMSVHLKSGCFSGNSRDACPTLFDQVPVLEAWIDERGAAGRAVIIGGDFNRRLEADNDRVWHELNDHEPVDLVVAGEGIGPECDPRYREFIDFLIMNEGAATMTRAGSFHETTFEEDRRPSDHCPISITLR